MPKPAPKKVNLVDTSRVSGLKKLLNKFDRQDGRLLEAQLRYSGTHKELEKDFSLGSSKKVTTNMVKWRAVSLARKSIKFKKMIYLLRHAKELKLTDVQVNELQEAISVLERDSAEELDNMLEDKADLRKPF